MTDAKSDEPEDAGRGSWLHRYHLIFRSENLRTLGLLWVFCALGMLIYIALQYSSQGELGDIDDLPPRPVQFQVDINSAEWPELANLPGIGPVLAKSIVERRNERGGFSKLEEVKSVPRIGDAKFQLIQPFLILDSESRFQPDESAVSQ